MRLRPTIPRLLQVVLLKAKYMRGCSLPIVNIRGRKLCLSLQLSQSAVRSAQTIPICCI